MMRHRSAASPDASKHAGKSTDKWAPWKRTAHTDAPSRQQGRQQGRRQDEPQDELSAALEASLKSYLPPGEIESIRRAYLFSANAHTGQKRMSGEPYISHPVKVAQAMAELRLDATTIIAGILHDVLEDTHVTKNELVKKFGKEVSEIVDGVSHIDHLHLETRETKQSANFQKMILAMSKDLRVILVKLTDRLHNMRTLRHLPTTKQRLIAKETLEIYAPISQRLGIDAISRELEELGFKALYPMRHRALSQAVEQSGGRRKKMMRDIQNSFRKRLSTADIAHEVFSRRKNIYSIYKKMKQKRLPFSEVFDVFALRLIVERVDDCYRALGLIHNLYKPVPGRFKDYIAIPKANGYQSLHTVLFGPQAIPIEVQIRTREMDNVAEHGIAAHAVYKASGRSDKGGHAPARKWARHLVELREHTGSSGDFLENVKMDLFPDEVYVFTPQGEIMTLPRGATVLDFAFAVHTDVGMTYSSALVDKHPTPMSTELGNGQTVEIISDRHARPTPLWLAFATTAKARAAIRSHLKSTGEKAAVQLGKRLLKNTFESNGLNLSKVGEPSWRRLLEQLGLENAEDLFREIGLGNQLPPLIARRLLDSGDAASASSSDKPLAITGAEGVVVTYAKCCHPIPGDAIVGLLSPGKGLVVHRNSCNNVARAGDGDKSLLLHWAKDGAPDVEYSAAIRTVTQHRRGMLAVIADKIAQTGSNIENVTVEERPGATALLTFTLSVKNRDHLADLMRRIRGVSKDVRVSRIK